MKHISFSDMPCPVARTLDIIGEWWTSLVLRDAIRGATKFQEFKATGIADNILSARLKRLCETGIMERRLYQTRPDRYEYVLTEKGRALSPVIAALRDWGLKWTTGEDHSPALVHAPCGSEIEVGLYCSTCGERISAADVRAAHTTEGKSRFERVKTDTGKRT